MAVFLTNGSFHLASTMMHSLGRQNVKVYAGDVVNYRFGSRFCSGYFRYPLPSDPSFIDALYKILEKNAFDILIPMSNSTLLPIAKNKAMLEEVTSIPIPDYATVMMAMDKYETFRLASAAGIAVPKTILITDNTDAADKAEEIGYPLIVKPRTSEGSSQGVVRIDSPEFLEITLEKLRKSFGDMLLQEYIPGNNTAMRMANVLYDKNSRPVAMFTAKKIREYPITGGITTLGESTHDPEIMENAGRLFGHMRWYGVAEAEFKTDIRDNKPRLIEINPRFWSYLRLPVYCGIDFPYLLYRTARGDTIPCISDYQAGAKYVHPGRDPLAVMQFIKKNPGFGSISRIFQSYRGLKTNTYPYLDDPMLFIEKPIINLKKIIFYH